MTDDEATRCGKAMDDLVKVSGSWWDSLNSFERHGFRQGWEQAWAARSAPSYPPPGTVRVRVPVLTNSDGQCLALKYPEDSDESAARWIKEETGAFIDGDTRLSWITADVPLPSPPIEVEGTVESCPTPHP